MISAQAFVCYCNKALYYSEIFHWIIESLKWDLVGKPPNNLKKILDSWQGSKKFWKVLRLAKKFPDGLKHFPFQMALDSFNRWPKKAIWKVFRWPGIFTVGLDSFQMAWNFCGWPRKFSDGLDSFQIAWTDSACLESFQMAWNVNRYMAGKVSRWSGTFPGFMDSFLSTWPGMFSDGLFPKIFQVHKNFPGSTASLLSWFFPPLIFTMKGFNNGWNQNLELKIVVLILRSDHSFWYGCIFRQGSVSSTYPYSAVRPLVGRWYFWISVFITRPASTPTF